MENYRNTLVDGGVKRTMAVYEHRQRLAFVNQYSDRCRSIAEAVAKSWLSAGTQDFRHIVDLGTGDGVLFKQLLNRLPAARRLSIVDTDDLLREQAAKELGQAGHRVDAYGSDAELQEVSHYLASHVIYYLPSIDSWLAGVVGKLAPQGVVAIVLRDDGCTTNHVREVVRRHENSTAHISISGLVGAMSELGLGTHDLIATTTWKYGVKDGWKLCADLADSVDPELDSFIRWMARIPFKQRIEPSLLVPLCHFLSSTVTDGVMVWQLRDRVITGERPG
jgi:hypothetical protein